MSYHLTAELWAQHQREATKLIDDMKTQGLRPAVLLTAAARVVRLWESKSAQDVMSDPFEPAIDFFGELVKLGEEAFGQKYAAK